MRQKVFDNYQRHLLTDGYKPTNFVHAGNKKVVVTTWMGNHISKVDNSKKTIRVYRSRGTTLSEQGDTTKATVRVKAKLKADLKKGAI